MRPIFSLAAHSCELLENHSNDILQIAYKLNGLKYILENYEDRQISQCPKFAGN